MDIGCIFEELDAKLQTLVDSWELLPILNGDEAEKLMCNIRFQLCKTSSYEKSARSHLPIYREMSDRKKASAKRLNVLLQWITHIEKNIPQQYLDVQELKVPAVIKPMSTPFKMPLTHMPDTPNCFVPVVKRVLKFGDVPDLTEEDLRGVPSYMKGRLQLSTVNEFIHVFNAVMNRKYNLLAKNSTTKLHLKDQEQIRRYQADATVHQTERTFITEVDLRKMIGVMTLDKQSLNMLAILRHLGKISLLNRGTNKAYTCS